MASELVERMAREFHERYERLAPEYGYETRSDTREFDPDSPNGKLMVAVCQPFADALAAAEKRISQQCERQMAERDNAAYWRHEHDVAEKDIEALTVRLCKQEDQLAARDARIERLEGALRRYMGKFGNCGDAYQEAESALHPPDTNAP